MLRFSYSHNANTGHEVKSRAKVNYILYNRLADEATGNASYEVDISNGGLTYIVGNIIQKGPNRLNGNTIAYAEEGATNPIQKLYIASNTIVNAYPLPDNRWVLLLGSGVTEANMVNNLVVGLSSSFHLANGPGASVLQERHDVITNEPGFFKQTDRNYFLTASSPAVNAGIDPGSVNGFSLKPLYEFQFPASGVARPVSNGLDAGAYQYKPGQVMPEAPVVSSNSPVADLATRTPRMTPAILLVTLSLYNQPASNSQTKFASMEDCQAARTKMLMDEQRSRDKAQLADLMRAPPSGNQPTTASVPLPMVSAVCVAE